jgi:hypothetical protein
VQAFPVRLPSGAASRPVLYDDLEVVAYLHQLRFGHDAAETMTKAYAGALALYLGWRARTGQHWTSAARLSSLMVWLKHTPADRGQPVVAGPPPELPNGGSRGRSRRHRAAPWTVAEAAERAGIRSSVTFSECRRRRAARAWTDHAG